MRRLLLAVVTLAAITLTATAQTVHPRPAAKPPAKPQPSAKPIPLTPRERALQLLNRFTFGPRPGDLEQVLATGSDQWFEQQLTPASIPDKALDRRLADYPTLTMTPAKALQLFPDRNTITQIAQGKAPAPTDPLLAAVYEVQIFKYNRELAARTPDATGQIPVEPTDAEKAAQKLADQATAARIAGDLFSLPKNQRMLALTHMPVPDRIAFTTYVGGDQRNLLLADFTPREREIFNSMAANIGAQYQIVNELQQARLVREILSERQVQEVMTDFWFNHFNIFVPKDSDQWYTTSYERDAIRAHALGKFRDLLLATAESPAMMVYLDNWLSIGPDSVANGVIPANPKSKRGNKGLNENYGREVMELHTVGVNGGYTQADVTALAAILTGWGVDNPGKAGPFLFDPNRHQPGPKQWFGHTIGNPTSSGMNEGIEALTILAAAPQTAHFISFLLAQRFVADEPPPALVDRLAATYLTTDGDIKEVLRTLVSSQEFNSRRYFRNKVKTPIEFIASAFRTTVTDPQNPGALVNTLKQMGMPLYYALPPTGYYLTADQWMNSTALVDRLNFAYQLTSNKFSNQKFDAAHVLAFGLLSEPAAPIQTTRAHPIVGAPPAANVNVSGADTMLRVIENTLLGVQASAQANDLIHKQIDQQPAANPTDTLNLITALILGSPDFQFR